MTREYSGIRASIAYNIPVAGEHTNKLLPMPPPGTSEKSQKWNLDRYSANPVCELVCHRKNTNNSDAAERVGTLFGQPCRQPSPDIAEQDGEEGV